MKMRTLPLALVLLAACDTQADSQTGPSVSVVGDTTFLELPVGTSASNGDLSVRFDNVTEDSRCPRGVQCVWEGNASLLLTLTSGGETELVVVNSALEPQRVAFAGYTIGYRDLSPYPVSEQPVDRGLYMARIAIVDTG